MGRMLIRKEFEKDITSTHTIAMKRQVAERAMVSFLRSLEEMATTGAGLGSVGFVDNEKFGIGIRQNLGL